MDNLEEGGEDAGVFTALGSEGDSTEAGVHSSGEGTSGEFGGAADVEDVGSFVGRFDCSVKQKTKYINARK